MTRIHAAPATTALPASPVARRSSEPQLCSGSAPRPPGESDKGSYASPSHTLCKASPSPSLSSYSDPDSGHYCQLQPPARSSHEWSTSESSSRQTRSYGERLKELSENGAPEGDWGRTFTTPVVEAASAFNPASFQSLLIPKENRPLEVGLLCKVKELLAEVDARTLAQHVTKVDCLVGGAAPWAGTRTRAWGGLGPEPSRRPECVGILVSWLTLQLPFLCLCWGHPGSALGSLLVALGLWAMCKTRSFPVVCLYSFL